MIRSLVLAGALALGSFAFIGLGSSTASASCGMYQQPVEENCLPPVRYFLPVRHHRPGCHCHPFLRHPFVQTVMPVHNWGRPNSVVQGPCENGGLYISPKIYTSKGAIDRYFPNAKYACHVRQGTPVHVFDDGSFHPFVPPCF